MLLKWRKKTRIDSEKMSGWYDPCQLYDTGRKTLISTIIAQNADQRLVSGFSPNGNFFDYSHQLNKSGFTNIADLERDEIWIDYVSDVGDGWNSTYSVAYCLAKPTLKPDEADTELKRGEILILGGDEVYPAASRKLYGRRLEKPYSIAFAAHRNKTQEEKTNASAVTNLRETPHLFAIPGNHDWYDSLSAFRRLFCTHVINKRKFARGWRTRQEQSYFAIKLPHKWWLFGIDFQLSHDLDVTQLRFFENIIADRVDEGDKIILCVPEPYWTEIIRYRDEGRRKRNERSIERLGGMIKEKKARVRLYLAGDLHHYRRFERKGVHKITAGGGGAFLHPTHGDDFRISSDDRGSSEVGNKNNVSNAFEMKKEYPSREASRRLGWRCFIPFFWLNPKFGLLSAALYALLAVMLTGRLQSGAGVTAALGATAKTLMGQDVIALLVVILIIAGLIFFTDSASRLYNFFAGLTHSLFHLTAIIALGWLGYFFGETLIQGWEIKNDVGQTALRFLSILVTSVAGGYIFGSLIMGWYLGVSLQLFKRHDNEAFSALRIEGFKNFLRLHINKKGDLTIYPFKLEEVGTEWDDDKRSATEASLDPQLIETPITIN